MRRRSVATLVAIILGWSGLAPIVTTSPALATTCSIPNTFINGQTSDANTINANFTALQSCGNNIDFHNIGSVGIYASQIIPDTAAHATFSAAVGWTITTSLANAVPLTVNTAASPTVDALDVQINGVKKVFIDSTGALNTTVPSVFSAPAGLTATFGTANTTSWMLIPNTSTATGATHQTQIGAGGGFNPVAGVSPSVLAVADFGSGGAPLLGLDATGTLGLAGGLKASSGTFSSTLTAPSITAASGPLNVTSASGNNAVNVNFNSGATGGLFVYNGSTAAGPIQAGAITATGATYSGGVTISPNTGAGLRIGANGAVTDALFIGNNLGTTAFTQIGSNSGLGAAGVNGSLFYLYSNGNATFTGTFFAIDGAGNGGFAGSLTASSFNVSSRREWKKNVTALSDPLAMILAPGMQSLCWSYNGKGPTRNEPGTAPRHCGPMANDAPAFISGPKHDHIDEGSLAGLTLGAVQQLARKVRVLEREAHVRNCKWLTMRKVLCDAH